VTSANQTRYPIGNAVQSGWRILADVIDPATPATQTLERGSSVTHNSLEASQCPHISMIDRRHFDYAALPIGCPFDVQWLLM